MIVLLDSVLVDLEVVLLQVGHELALPVADDGVGRDEIDGYPEDRLLVCCSGWACCGCWLCCGGWACCWPPGQTPPSMPACMREEETG